MLINLCIPRPPAVHAYSTYCTTPAFPAPAWCSQRLPSLYAHVQARYWDVGFLRFYNKVDRVRLQGAMCFPFTGLASLGGSSSCTWCIPPKNAKLLHVAPRKGAYAPPKP